MQREQLQADEVLYMGDDIPDYEVMQAVGCPCCPADAAEEIKAVSCYVSPRAGGEGCVRHALGLPGAVLRLHSGGLRLHRRL